MSSLAAAGFLLVAGAVAGAVGSAGGITSLVSYPALLAVGQPALAANVANLIAVVACWPGAALSSRRELVGTARLLRYALPVAAAGGALGSVLLLSTSAGVFDRVVPFLVAAGSLTLLVQPALTARRARRPGGQLGPLGGVGGLSVYGGYFGAGSGVMLLALTLIFAEPRMPQANAIKNMLVGAAAVPPAIVFIFFATSVPWAAVLPLGVGLFAGSTAGPVVARHLPATVLRWVVAGLGLVLAVGLWVRL
jgi:uncharacterized membrane protein YfcA